MFEVSATSALVLLWTDHSIYNSQSAQAFLSNVSLDAGKGLRDDLSLAIKGAALSGLGQDESVQSWRENFVQNLDQEVTYRKYAVKTFCAEFLSSAPDAQVIFLGAGLDPKSLDVAETFPQSTVFDVDRDNVELKANITKSIGGPKNLSFCKGDVAASQELADSLSQHGWDAEKPTLIVAEGISYYVQKASFKKTLKKLKTAKGGLILEYSLPNEAIELPIVAALAKEFFQRIQDLLQFPVPLCRYNEEEAMGLAQGLNGSLVRTVCAREMEREKTGSNTSYQNYDGFVRVSFIRF